jgi:hypothetical protein
VHRNSRAENRYYTVTMTVTNIVSSIDAQIARLVEARHLLTGTVTSTGNKAATKKSASKKTTRKRVMSAEAREKIAAAQRKRWAAQKKAKK